MQPMKIFAEHMHSLKGFKFKCGVYHLAFSATITRTSCKGTRIQRVKWKGLKAKCCFSYGTSTMMRSVIILVCLRIVNEYYVVKDIKFRQYETNLPLGMSTLRKFIYFGPEQVQTQNIFYLLILRC